tara:strand:- start:604 stop:1227 length:624 start_codon:yes stop_codon:yes gene_type:complete
MSDDSLLTPEKLISEAKRIGLDGVCITDHDRFWDPADIIKLGKDNDFLTIPGCEVTTEEGHVLVYGLREYIFGMHKSDFVRDLVNESGGAMVVAHPYRRVYRENAPQDPDSYNEMVERALRNPVFGLVEAVEIKNGRGTKKENLFAEKIAERLSMPTTGASDAHKISDIGTYATNFFDTVTDLDSFILAIKSGRFNGTTFRRPSSQV